MRPCILIVITASRRRSLHLDGDRTDGWIGDGGRPNGYDQRLALEHSAGEIPQRDHDVACSRIRVIRLAPRLLALISRLRVAKAVFFAAIMFAFGLAYLADLAGSAVIIGAFAAGLVLARTDRGRDIEHEVYDVAQFFIPIFFVKCPLINPRML